MTDQANGGPGGDAGPQIDKWIAALVDFRTRRLARVELVQRGEDAVPALARATRHPIEGVRWSAIRTLADIGTGAALDALVDALDHPPTRDHACRALREISGREFPADTDAWRAWREGRTPAAVAAPPEAEVLGATDTSAMTPEEILASTLEGTGAGITRDGDLFRAVVPLDRGRSQQVVISFAIEDEDGEPIVYLYTECGPAATEQYDQVFRRNLTIPYGRIAIRKIDGRDQFVMAHQMLRQGLNLAGMRKAVLSLAKEGDALELELTRQDII